MEMSKNCWMAAFSLAALLGVAGTSHAASVVLNEYNAVGSEKYLDDGEIGVDTDPYAQSDKSDTRLGRIVGNGGNWIELAVIGDGTAGSTVDMRGWTLDWQEGSDAGSITVSNDTFWSSVKAGTLITIGELETLTAESGATVVNGSDTGIDFATGDNWAHVWSFDTQFITGTTTNVSGDGSGNFSVGNDDWQLTIMDSLSATVFGPEGEGISDGGVNSFEVYKLEADATASTFAGSGPYPYSDGTSSSFGGANVWSGGDFTQDFSVYGIVPEPTSLALLGLGGLVLVARKRRA